MSIYKGALLKEIELEQERSLAEEVNPRSQEAQEQWEEEVVSEALRQIGEQVMTIDNLSSERVHFSSAFRRDGKSIVAFDIEYPLPPKEAKSRVETEKNGWEAGKVHRPGWWRSQKVKGVPLNCKIARRIDDTLREEGLIVESNPGLAVDTSLAYLRLVPDDAEKRKGFLDRVLKIMNLSLLATFFIGIFGIVSFGAAEEGYELGMAFLYAMLLLLPVGAFVFNSIEGDKEFSVGAILAKPLLKVYDRNTTYEKVRTKIDITLSNKGIFDFQDRVRAELNGDCVETEIDREVSQASNEVNQEVTEVIHA